MSTPGKTYVNAALSSNTVSVLLGGSDGVGISPGHTLFDVNGAPIGVAGNPIVITSDAAADTSLATIATNTGAGATASGQASALTQMTAAATALGTPADTAWASGNGGVVALLKAVVAAIKGTLTVSVSNLPTTQAVTDAATEAGFGTPADAAYAGSGSAGAIALLKGLYAKLAGTLTATISGSVTVSNFPTTQPVSGTVALSGTSPVSLAALPALTAGSATIGAVTQASGPWTVSGSAAAGSAPSSPPLSVSGVDGSGNKQHLATDTAGRLQTVDQSYATHAPAYVQVTIGTTAQTLAGAGPGGLGVTIPTWATMAFVTPETGGIRYRADGTAPTTSAGQPIAQSQSWPVQSAAALAAAQFIAGATTTVSVEFRG